MFERFESKLHMGGVEPPPMRLLTLPLPSKISRVGKGFDCRLEDMEKLK